MDSHSERKTSNLKADKNLALAVHSRNTILNTKALKKWVINVPVNVELYIQPALKKWTTKKAINATTALSMGFTFFFEPSINRGTKATNNKTENPRGGQATTKSREVANP
jgi:hypothetical protein